MGEKTLLEYWFVLYSRKWVIVIVTLSAFVSAVVLSKRLHPVYEAKAVFFVPKEPDVTTFIMPQTSASRRPFVPFTQEDPHGPYLGILKSRTIAELAQQEFPHKTVKSFMRKDMDFVLTNEYMIEIYARDKDPHIAASIANSYVKYFRQLMNRYSLASELRKQNTIKEDIRKNKRKLSRAKGMLRLFEQKNKTANLDEEVKQLISMKSVFKSQLENARVSYYEGKKQIQIMEKKLREEAMAIKGSEFLVTNPLLEKLRAQLVDLEAKKASLRVEIKETHPEYMILQENYEKVKKNIDKEVENIIKSQIKAPDTFYENLRRQLVNLYINNEKTEANIRGVKKVLRRVENRISEIPKLKSRLDTLTVEVDRYKRLIDTLYVNLEEVKAQIRRAPQVAVLVEEAVPPVRPSFPILWLNAIVASLAGFVGGVFYCFFINYLEETRKLRVYRLLKAIESTEGKISTESKISIESTES
ncbi:MAG: hypothetical protein E3K32_07515 [wastewater metagenome]|nr:hypothetical protein [Candidatus Loosdrechtia aerotolerans]